MTTDLAEDFEENFERNNIAAAHKIQGLVDIGAESVLKVFKDSDLVALLVEDSLYINSDNVESVCQNADEEEEDKTR